MKKIFAFLLILLMGGPVWADTMIQGAFKSVSGDVQLKTNNRWLKAEKDLHVSQGELITAGDNSTAVLQVFDGSELTIAPNTKFILTALQKPSADDKVIKFKLVWGRLTALVKKLTTSHSAFEIEAGGVVCGVRGTQFSMSCTHDEKPQVVVEVKSGSVYTVDGLGNHFVVQTGGKMNFFNGTRTDSGNVGNGNNNGGTKKTSGNTGNGGSNNGTSGNSASSTTSSGNGSSTGSGTGSTTGSSTGSSSDNGSGTSTTGSSNSSRGGDSTGGSNPPPASGADTGSGNAPGSGLNDLNHQFQNNVLVNNDNTISNPAVQQALQQNFNLTVGQ